MRKADLISYLPPIIRDVRELKAITDAENPEFRLVFGTSEQVLKNQFIHDCDIDGISRYESVLGIKPTSDDTLESRVFRVSSRWNEKIPYTWKVLLERLDALCGKDNYIIELRPNEYEVELKVYLPFSGQVSELEYMLSYMIPANMVAISSNVLNYKAVGTIYAASTNIEVMSYEISSELSNEFIIKGNIFNASTMVKILEYIID